MKKHTIRRTIARRRPPIGRTEKTFVYLGVSIENKALAKKMLAPLSAAILASYSSTSADAATTMLPGANASNAIVDRLEGIVADDAGVRVYGDDDLHYFTRDLTSTGSVGTSNSLEDAMVYTSSLDGVSLGDNAFNTINIGNGSGEHTRGFSGTQLTHALHGAVEIAGQNYTLATTSNAIGDLTTAWYNTSNIGGGPIQQTINIAPMIAELGISTADQITGGTMYLAIGGETNNLNHYIPMWNTQNKITQFNPSNGEIESFVAGADDWQDIHIQGNDLYTVEHISDSLNGIGQVERHDFSGYLFSVPEPSFSLLLGIGTLGLSGIRRRD